MKKLQPCMLKSMQLKGKLVILQPTLEKDRMPNQFSTQDQRCLSLILNSQLSYLDQMKHLLLVLT